VARQFLEELIMSLLALAKSAESKALGGLAKGARPGRPGSAIAGRLRNSMAVIGRTLANAFNAIAEARMQRAMIEAQLYLNRYKHTSKNDDDLPVVR
jgi:hypothetical protein